MVGGHVLHTNLQLSGEIACWHPALQLAPSGAPPQRADSCGDCAPCCLPDKKCLGGDPGGMQFLNAWLTAPKKQRYLATLVGYREPILPAAPHHKEWSLRGTMPQMVENSGGWLHTSLSDVLTVHLAGCQTDKDQGVIQVATLCGYPCERLFRGNSLLAYKSSTERLGFTKMLSVTLLPSSPLPAGAAPLFCYYSTRFPVPRHLGST